VPSQKNLDAVKAIDEKLKKCKNIILVNPEGLSVAAQTELRRLVKEAGGEYTVHKNTLLKVTLKNRAKSLPEDVFNALEGPTAVVYGNEDAVSATKVTVNFAKEHEDSFVIKVGVLAGEGDNPHTFLDLSAINNLATLPGRDELRARLVGQLGSPISGFVNVLAGNIRGLAYVLKARQEQLAAS
jgi:large subunit ribosomal protein L10